MHKGNKVYFYLSIIVVIIIIVIIIILLNGNLFNKNQSTLETSPPINGFEWTPDNKKSFIDDLGKVIPVLGLDIYILNHTIPDYSNVYGPFYTSCLSNAMKFKYGTYTAEFILYNTIYCVPDSFKDHYIKIDPILYNISIYNKFNRYNILFDKTKVGNSWNYNITNCFYLYISIYSSFNFMKQICPNLDDNNLRCKIMNFINNKNYEKVYDDILKNNKILTFFYPCDPNDPSCTINQPIPFPIPTGIYDLK